MHVLDNPIRNYAWGSRTELAALLGRPSPTDLPEAEMWLGAHPLLPSRVAPLGLPLDEWIARDPERALGVAASRFGNRLPFMMKLLAADAPLSIQTHPGSADAARGFAEENARRVALTAPERSYPDAHAKPELLCALGTFDALVGFAPPEAILALFQRLDSCRFDPFVEPLRAAPDTTGIRGMFTRILALGADAGAVVEVFAKAASRELAKGDAPAILGWGLDLAARYPGDPGVLAAMMMNYVQLAPGEAMFLPPSHLHAYLRGVGIEIMATSDNVLRAGLTPKYVNHAELLRVTTFEPLLDARVAAVAGGGEPESVYDTQIPEFRLSRIDLEDGHSAAPLRRGPEILLCMAGTVVLHTEDEELELTPGRSVFVAADEPAYLLDGRGSVFRATTGDPRHRRSYMPISVAPPGAG